MYKIGQTDGVAKCCSNVGVPVACIKTYLMKMAKSAADLPCKCKAKSDMQVLASGEFAASTSSCCAGGTSSKTGCGGGGCCCGGCCGKSSCGGKGCPPNLYSGSGANDEKTQNVLDLAAAKEQAAFAEEEKKNQPQPQIADAFQSTAGGSKVSESDSVKESDPSVTDKIVSGAKAVGGKILSTIDDVLTSTIPDQHQAQWETAKDFQAEVCQNHPYPECKYCQYVTTVMEMNEFDIVDYLHGIQDCLDALNQGQVGWAEQRFVCPGQVAAMLGDEFGEVGLLAGRTAAAALIGSMALHGALKSLRSFSRQAAHHDLRQELTSTLCSAIKSGGGGSSYVNLLNDIMCNLGVDAKDQFRASSWSKGGRTCGGGSQRTTPTRAAETTGTRIISEEAKAAAESVGALTKALTKPTDTVSSEAPISISGNTYVPSDDRTSQVDPSHPVKDGKAKPKTYFYQDSDGDYVPLDDIPIGSPLAPYEAEHGKLYTEANVNDLISKVASTPGPAVEIAKNLVKESARTGIPLEDLIEEMVETTVVSDRADQTGPKINGSATSLDHSKVNPTTLLPPGTTESANAKLNVINDIAGTREDNNTASIGNGGAPTINPNDSNATIDAGKESMSREKVPTAEAIDKAYDSPVLPVSGGGGAASRALFENDLVDARDVGKDPDVIIQAARALEALSKIPAPLILPNNRPLEPVLSMNARDYEENVIFTPSLVTRNQVPACEMAKLAGIDLDMYDLSMAYALDHDVNGSTLPRDVRARRIPTILDTFPVW